MLSDIQMSKAGKRGKSAQGGAGGPPKWEQALLGAQFEEARMILLVLFIYPSSCTLTHYKFLGNVFISNLICYTRYCKDNDMQYTYIVD